MQDLNATQAAIQALFDQEHKAGAVLGLRDREASLIRREQINTLIEELTNSIGLYQSIANNLPKLAPYNFIEEARAIIDMEGLVFLEVDTTGLTKYDEVCRVLLLNINKQIIDDILVKPGRELNEGAANANGLTMQDLENAETFPQAYEHIREVLRGRYIVSYGLQFDEKAINQTCEIYRLPTIKLIGDCLQQRAGKYWGKSSIKLSEAAHSIGDEMPARPHQTAHDRAMAQQSVLYAMSVGVYDVYNAPLPPYADTNELDTDGALSLNDHPF